jgi:hypothetical protein
MTSPPPEPPLLPTEELRNKALGACAKHVEATLEGTYHLETLPHELEWSPVELRHHFEQPLVIWRSYDTFEVVLDEENQAVGFVDGDKWRSCAWQELPVATAEALARATGLVPARFALTNQQRGEKDCLELVFSEDRLLGRLRVRINPARRVVISVEPVEESPP